MTGFGYDDGVLESIADSLDQAGSLLDEGVAGRMGVDAGQSSTEVVNAMRVLAESGTAMAQILSEMGTKVFVGLGSYDGIDNTNEGLLRWQNEPPDDPHAPHTGPLLDAPATVDTLGSDRPWEGR